MGLARLGEIADGLVEHGLDADTPAAVISAGTTADQESVTATIATVADAAEGLRPPALIVVGDVVALSERLARVRGKVLETGSVLSLTQIPA